MKRLLGAIPLSIALLSSSFAYADERPNFDAYSESPAALAVKPSSQSPAAVIASVDEKRGIPTFLWAAAGANGQDGENAQAAIAARSPEQAARLFLGEHAAAYGVSPAALATAKVTHIHDTGRGGIVVTLRQEIGGIELFHNDVKVLLTRDRKLVAISGNPHADGVPGTKGRRWNVAAAKALAAAFADLYGITVPASAMKELKIPRDGYSHFDLIPTKEVKASYLRFIEPARVKKVFFPLPDRVVPAYFVEIEAGRTYGASSDLYHYVIAADDGRLLFRQNRTFQDAFDYRVWADTAGDHRPLEGTRADFTPHPTGIPSDPYPPHIPPNLVSMEGFNTNPNKVADPWLAPDATETSGNNVDAYADFFNPTGFSPGDLRGSTTSPHTFDYTYNTAVRPTFDQNQLKASATQIFYTTNWLHDWWYDSGFNEGAGNAQKSNFGRGGAEGDPLLAETQNNYKGFDGDIAVPADGKSPRMQMYDWGERTFAADIVPLNVSLNAAESFFGIKDFDITGEVVVADDGTGTASDGCEPIMNDVAGKIVLLDTGGCADVAKVQNAQNHGAIGALVASDTPGAGAPYLGPYGYPDMGPTLALSFEDGSTLKTALMNGSQSVHMAWHWNDDARDGSLDGMFVAHEWSHLIHERMVAGTSAQCAAESEGFGDYAALQMILREGDDLDGTYAFGAHVGEGIGPDTAYHGVRRLPYSVDLSKNPLTFKHITQGEALPASPAPYLVYVQGLWGDASYNNRPHNAGEIWASMLFEALVAMLKETQGPNPPRTFDEAKRAMSDYVVAGLQMAPSDPTFSEQRDALLAVAAASNKDDMLTIAKAFAKRGAGTCAISPPRGSSTLAGVVEDFEVRPAIKIVSVKVDDSVKSCDSDGTLDAGETGIVTVEVMNAGMAALKGTTGAVSSSTPGVSFPEGPALQIPDMEPFATAKVTVKIGLDASVTSAQELGLNVTVSNGAACAPEVTDTSSRNANTDDKPSKIDTVESEHPTWMKTGISAEAIWARSAAGTNHFWSGIDFGAISDTALESPDLQVSAADNFVITFEHSHQFETSDGIFWDGGIIEISEDGGKSWADISKYVDPGYNVTLGFLPTGALNPLNDMKAFGDKNPSYPAMDKVTLDLGTQVAGKTVRIRFRIGTDEATDAEGWKLDNIEFQGIDNEPFWLLVDDMTACDGGAGGGAGGDGGSGAGGSGDGGSGGSGGSGGAVPGPQDDRGCGCVVTGAPSSTSFAPFAALGLLLLRRRRMVARARI